MIYKNSRSFANILDREDPLAKYRDKFFYPKSLVDQDVIYLCGNSLGLQLKTTSDLVQNELSLWARKGVLGQDSRWISFHEKLTNSSAGLVGALPSEVVIMNALTVNIHLLLISFYRPNQNRFKIIIEEDIFPSIRIARSALDKGFIATSFFNAANEIAVDSFLNEKIKFTDIFSIVETVTSLSAKGNPNSIEEVFEYDKLARKFAYNEVRKYIL